MRMPCASCWRWSTRRSGRIPGLRRSSRGSRNSSMASHHDFAYVLKCCACGKEEFIDLAGAVRRLSDLGMLRRQKEPDVDLVSELLSSAVPRMACRGCEATAFELSDAEAWDDMLPAAKACERCGGAISTERLEILPDAKLCIGCQTTEESGDSSEEQTYCSKCGSVMQVREVRRGISRYQLVCPVCRR